MDDERALGKVNTYIGWCERSIWIQSNTPKAQLLGTAELERVGGAALS